VNLLKPADAKPTYLVDLSGQVLLGNENTKDTRGSSNSTSSVLQNAGLICLISKLCRLTSLLLDTLNMA
jgi:hypothetical protein